MVSFIEMRKTGVEGAHFDVNFILDMLSLRNLWMCSVEKLVVLV